MITFISTLDGDWNGMYIDDTLVIQNHSLYAPEVVLQLIKFSVDLKLESVQHGMISMLCIEDNGWQLPAHLQDVETDPEWPLEKYEI